MVVAGLLLLTLGYAILSIPPLVTGVSLIAYYRKYLIQMLGF